MIAQAQSFDVLEAFAIILSVVSLIISIVAFFASLKFYRDGVNLQQAANDALTKISEKTAFIQTQVGGMFDKTLDAAIGKREILSNQFEELTDQLEKTKVKLIEESIGQIGAAGEQERQRLSSIVDHQMALIREKVETTRESAEQMAQPATLLRPTSWRDVVLAVLVSHPEGLTVKQIRERMDMPHISDAKLYQHISALREAGVVESRDGKHFLTRPNS